MDRAALHLLAKLYGSPSSDSGVNVMMRCPLAGSRHKNGTDNNPSFSVKVSPSEQSVSQCFACGFAGPVRIAFEDAGDAFSECRAHIEATDRGGLEGALSSLRRARADDAMPSVSGVTTQGEIERYIAKCMRLVPNYLIERGIIRTDVEKWRLGFDEEIKRAIFPLWDERGTLVGCDRRTIFEDDGRAKYHAWPTGFHKKDFFYGEHLVDTTLERGYFVEGPMDTVFASRMLPNTLGFLGARTGIGPVRLSKLRRWFKRLTFIFDGDEPGDEAVNGWIDQMGDDHPGLRQILRTEFVIDVVELPYGEDPCSLIRKSPATFMECVARSRYLGFTS